MGKPRGPRRAQLFTSGWPARGSGLSELEKMDRGRVAIAVVCAGIVLTVVVWVVLAALAGKLLL